MRVIRRGGHMMRGREVRGAKSHRKNSETMTKTSATTQTTQKLRSQTHTVAPSTVAATTPNFAKELTGETRPFNLRGAVTCHTPCTTRAVQRRVRQRRHLVMESEVPLELKSICGM